MTIGYRVVALGGDGKSRKLCKFSRKTPPLGQRLESGQEHALRRRVFHFFDGLHYPGSRGCPSAANGGEACKVLPGNRIRELCRHDAQEVPQWVHGRLLRALVGVQRHLCRDAIRGGVVLGLGSVNSTAPLAAPKRASHCPCPWIDAQTETSSRLSASTHSLRKRSTSRQTKT